jgi:hypothetical protein
MTSNDRLSKIHPDPSLESQRVIADDVLIAALRRRTNLSYTPQMLEFQKGPNIYSVDILPVPTDRVDKVFVVAHLDGEICAEFTVSVDYSAESRQLAIEQGEMNADCVLRAADLVAILEQSVVELES